MTDVMDPPDEVVPEGAYGPNAMINSAGAVLADPDAERALLGIVLLKPSTMADIVDEVGAGDFSDVMHRRIFEVCARAFDEGWAINIDAVIDGLGGDRNAKLIGDQTTGQFVAGLCIGVDTSLDAGNLAQHIFDCSERRAIDAEADGDLIEANKPFQSRMGLRLWIDQNDPGEEYEYIVEDLIPKGQLCLLIGESGTGKSFLTHHLAMCIARAVPFFGRRILKPCLVIWLAYEASQGARIRMRAYRKNHNLPLEPLPFAVLERPAKLWPADDSVDALLHEIKGICRLFPGVDLGAVVFDTHNAGTPGASEIDSETVSKIRDRYARISSVTGAALIIVGHTNAQGKHRGNEQLHNNVDTVIKVSRKTRTMGRDVFPIKDEDGFPIRVMKVAKQREGQDGDEHEFILRVVEDGTKTKFGKSRTSCVVGYPNVSDTDQADDMQSRPDVGEGVKASKNEALFLTSLLEALDESGVPPPPELQLPSSISRVVNYDAVKLILSKKMMNEGDDSEEGRTRHQTRVRVAVGRCRTQLMSVKVIDCSSPFIWWTGRAVRGVKATYPKSSDLFDPRATDHLTSQDISDLY